MKINWGVAITALYMSFVAMILLLVSMSVGQKIDLVTDHYYEEELAFQGKIDKKQRAAALLQPLTWEVGEKGIELLYPKDATDAALSGEISLYCPSDNRRDRKFRIVSQGQKQFIPASEIPEGRYQLQIDWKINDAAYWDEGIVVINH